MIAGFEGFGFGVYVGGRKETNGDGFGQGRRVVVSSSE